MSRLNPKEPELLPGANLDEDCKTAVSIPPATTEDHDEDDHHHRVTWYELDDELYGQLDSDLQSWQLEPRKWAVWLEKIALAFEKPVNKLTGSTQLNPLYHTGTIATFLLGVVGFTGFYLFLFFKYGFDVSYEAVVAYDSQFIARTMRAVHRYASDALVITTLLHAYRILFMERFRGPRWLAWVTGIVMTIFLWLAGVTGYWLIWDQRAQIITDAFVELLGKTTPWAANFVETILTAELSGKSWPFMFAILAVHVLLFLVTAVFFWYHIKRLKRPKWYPPLQWIIGMSLVLLIAALAFPLSNLLPASSTEIPATLSLDLIFLFFIPFVQTNTAVWLWLGLLLITIFSTALPWISRERHKVARQEKNEAETAVNRQLPKVTIIRDRCTGCTKCALDCPYKAIEMVERHDNKPHKYIAIEDPGLCISCGICVGSCDGVAVTMGQTPPAYLWDAVAMKINFAKAKQPEQPLRIVFTCDRHAAHGAQRYVAEEGGAVVADTAVEVVAVPCVGTIPPDVMTRALDAGADHVQVIGCPPDDCRNREGNVWTERRLLRKRVPRLKRAYADAPITAVWAAPNEFEDALRTEPILVKDEETGEEKPNYMASRRMFPALSWQNYAVAFLLLLIVTFIQVAFANISVPLPIVEKAQVRVAVVDPADLVRWTAVSSIPTGEFELKLFVDDQLVTTEQYDPERMFTDGAAPFYANWPLMPGEHHVKLTIENDEYGMRRTLFDETLSLQEGEIFPLNFHPDF